MFAAGDFTREETPVIALDPLHLDEVDFLDLAKLAQNYNTSVLAATNDTWIRGDFNYNGITDFLDLAQLAQHYNTAGAAIAMPSIASVLSQTSQSSNPVNSMTTVNAATVTKVIPRPVTHAKPKVVHRTGR